MKHQLTFVLAGVLVLGFSALVLAQSPAASQTKAPAAPMAQKAMPMHKEHMNLNKDEIMALQNALIKAGDYKGVATGKIDKATETALRQYQTTNKLKVTGWPDRETLDKLGVQYSKPAHHPAEHQASPKSEAAPQKSTPKPN
ncbi:MAG: hypothetical protein ALAOOOJD_01768 [bacterium]|nr:hypothetical protein [bacterium]